MWQNGAYGARIPGEPAVVKLPAFAQENVPPRPSWVPPAISAKPFVWPPDVRADGCARACGMVGVNQAGRPASTTSAGWLMNREPKSDLHLLARLFCFHTWHNLAPPAATNRWVKTQKLGHGNPTAPVGPFRCELWNGVMGIELFSSRPVIAHVLFACGRVIASLELG